MSAAHEEIRPDGVSAGDRSGGEQRGPTNRTRLRLGTRASALARWQAEWVASELTQRGATIELVPITTQGDVSPQSLGTIGGQGVFTKELQRALLDGAIDLAVHSLKDLPTVPVPGLRLAAVPQRESVRDALVCREATSLEQLPARACIGTGSARRRAQLLHARPDLMIREIRGNVDTRLRKLAEGHYDAIVLAEAGLRRLGLSDRVTQLLPSELMVSAAGQGALGIEVRDDDEPAIRAVAALDHRPTHTAVLAERTVLYALQAGCLAPVGAWARWVERRLRLDAVVLSSDGRRRIAVVCEDPTDDARALGERAAAELLERGAGPLIAELRRPG